MNNFELIKAVRARKPLWDKSTWDKVDVVAREELWNEVAEKMDVHKDIVKTRWKNLKDTYRKLLRKMYAIGNFDNPKWPFFKAMEFIKEITLSIKPKNTDITLRRNEPQLEADYSLTLLSPSVNDDGPLDPFSFTQKLARQQSQYQQAANRGTKRSAEEEDVTVDILELDSCGTGDTLRAKQLASKLNLQDDDDYQFLMSLYSHLKQVPTKRKLMLRMKIEQLIHDELYATSDAGTQTNSISRDPSARIQ